MGASGAWVHPYGYGSMMGNDATNTELDRTDLVAVELAFCRFLLNQAYTKA